MTRRTGGSRPRLLARRVAVVAALAVLAGAAWLGAPGPGPVHVTAYFERTTGIYPGSAVTVLGVPVGTVDEVTPAGDRVAVRLHYEGTRRVPADAQAAVVAPSLIAGRYVQLAPVYRGGPTLTDGAVIPLDRTAVPVEWDQLKQQLVGLSHSLAPNPEHPDGALNDLVRSADGVVTGNGAALRDSMTELSRATGALAHDRGNLFATVRNLDDVVTALNRNGRQVQAFSDQLDAVSGVLADNRRQLARLISAGDGALTDIDSFVRENSTRLGASVDGLAAVARQLADNQLNVANALHLGPSVLANAYAGYDPLTGSFTGREAFTQLEDLANTACQSTYSLGWSLRRCQGALGPLLERYRTPPSPLSINPLVETGAADRPRPGPPGGDR